MSDLRQHIRPGEARVTIYVEMQTKRGKIMKNYERIITLADHGDTGKALRPAEEAFMETSEALYAHLVVEKTT